MKRIIFAVAFISFALGLNATLTKEDIYNANPTQFKQLKKELSSLNQKELEKLKKSFAVKEMNEAFKAVFTNKEILKKSNYAIVKNGKIVKTGNAKDADGISFWHIPSSNLDNPVENTCVIQDASWEDGDLNGSCGMVAYKMDANSPYASMTDALYPPAIYLLPQVNFSDIENMFPDDVASSEQIDALSQFAILTTYDTETHPTRETVFENLQTVFDTTPAIGFIKTESSTNDIVFHKYISPKYSFPNQEKADTYFRQTEYIHPSPSIAEPIYTLRSGNYMQLLALSYNAGQYWWEGRYILFKWFNLNVENYYLGDVGIHNNNLNNLASIIWDNKQISIELDNSVDPAVTTCSIYDITGKVIQEELLSSTQAKVNMPPVASGVYIIRVKGSNFDLSKKIVFKK